MSSVLVTGGAGFIGSHLVDLLIEKGHHVVVIDKLTYAASMDNLKDAQETGQLTFIKEDICAAEKVYQALKDHQVQAVYHLAAESHVDNSIDDASPFLQTNVMGTYAMLTASTKYWEESSRFNAFRFIHVSTDEVFGHLAESDPPFNEKTRYEPNSPYSASKAASDHFARAWHTTYGLPVIVTNCSNNYGSRQHAEKLIPTIMRNALAGNPIPIYGNGKNVRDWLYVKDHCNGLYLACSKGQIGETYCFGGRNEKRNIDIANEICACFDAHSPREDGKSYASQVTFVEDRKGHDWRYAVDSTKSEEKLGWKGHYSLQQFFADFVQEKSLADMSKVA